LHVPNFAILQFRSILNFLGWPGEENDVEIWEAISKRCSIRKFQDKPVPPEMIEKMVLAGSRAPSARAVQPWEFVVVTGKQQLALFGQMAPNGAFIREAACCIAVFCRDTKYYLEDGSAATENILLAAAALGLGACWVAGDKKPYAVEVAKLLNAPDSMKLVSLIAVGWPGEAGSGVRRRDLAELLHWEKF
jgi:nitroreductase